MDVDIDFDIDIDIDSDVEIDTDVDMVIVIDIYIVLKGTTIYHGLVCVYTIKLHRAHGVGAPGTEPSTQR